MAVGECGLDFDRDFSPRPAQLKCFEEQIELSIEFKKPLFLHERCASVAFSQILRRYYPNGGAHGVVHCFTGNKEEAKAYLSMGLYIGITGWVADERRNSALLDALTVVPLDRLLIETDAPFLIPRTIRPRPRNNEPKYLGHVAAALAKIYRVSEEELRRETTKNAKKLFGLEIGRAHV